MLLGVAALLTAPAASPEDRWAPEIREASERFGLPPQWIERVIEAESGGRARIGGRPTVSRSGAMGLMQLMPGTWLELRARHRLGNDPHEPRNNILAGTAYLKEMYDRFGYPGLFAAYHAGPARYSAHLEGRGPLPAETRAYLAKLTGTPAIGVPRAMVEGVGTTQGGSASEALDSFHSPIFVPLGNPPGLSRP